jgi:hypothetical protein
MPTLHLLHTTVPGASHLASDCAKRAGHLRLAQRPDRTAPKDGFLRLCQDFHKRKISMFVGNPRGGWTAAVLSSVTSRTLVTLLPSSISAFEHPKLHLPLLTNGSGSALIFFAVRYQAAIKLPGIRSIYPSVSSLSRIRLFAVVNKGGAGLRSQVAIDLPDGERWGGSWLRGE